MSGAQAVVRGDYLELLIRKLYIVRHYRGLRLHTFAHFADDEMEQISLRSLLCKVLHSSTVLFILTVLSYQ